MSLYNEKFKFYSKLFLCLKKVPVLLGQTKKRSASLGSYILKNNNKKIIPTECPHYISLKRWKCTVVSNFLLLNHLSVVSPKFMF